MITIPGWTLLAIALAAAEPADTVPGRLQVAQPEGGPRVVVREQATPPLVALRLSVPVEEEAGLEGATLLLQQLVLTWLRAEAAERGVRLEAMRSPSHAVYSVVGARESFDDMVRLLQRAVGPPPARAPEVAAARVAIQQRASRDRETPEPLLRRRLQEALFPRLAPTLEDGAGLEELTPQRLVAFWARHFQPERMTAVVVGSVPAREAFAAFRDWPRPSEVEWERPRPAADDEASSPELISRWAGVGYLAEKIDPAALAVAALLLERQLAASELRTARAEVWWGAGRQGLVVFGAEAPAVDSAAAGAPGELARRLDEAVAAAAELATPVAVASARRTLETEIVLAARSPQGLAALIGEMLDRTGDPRALSDFLGALRELEADRVRSALRRLRARSPVVVELKP